ncbi:hypothetical protein GC174_04650 [bacterium]|nr:hypothetical protein [bacterium]
MSGPGQNQNSRTTAVSYRTLAAVVAVVVMAYQPVLFDFFVGDDFVHLIWLKKAMVAPELIWRNFYHNWLDITTTSFYRPLISVFMALDYYFGGANGLGFHLTNLFFHLVATVTIFFIARGVYTDSGSQCEREADIYGILAASIFGLYPLHTEAVSWITGRVDAVVTAFICLALCFYRVWRHKKDTISFIQTLLFVIAGLLSKEMAITLPAMFLVYSFILENKNAPFRIRAINSLKATIPFFILLAFYFALRKFALGTFVGGYDNSLLLMSDPGHFIATWLHGLRMFLIPLNREVIPSSHALTYAWYLILACIAFLFFLNLFRKKELRPLTLFNLALLTLAFLPVYKLFAIGNDLQGARLAQVATVPLALLLASAFTTSKPRLLIAGAYSLLLFSGLWLNNQVWAEAGRTVNAIRHALAAQYEKIKGDPPVLLLDLPDNIKGAYAMRNALDGLTKTPQFPRDLEHCLSVSAFEPIIPMGYLKESIFQSADKITVLSWSEAARDFKKIPISKAVTPGTETFKFADADALESGKELTLDLASSNLDCAEAEVLKVSGRGDADSAVLYYKTAIEPDFSNESSLVAQRKPDENSFYFPLGARPDFFLGGSGGKLKLKLLNPRQTFVLEEITILPKLSLMPTISFENSGYLGSKGFLHLSNSKLKEATIDVDASAVEGARKIRLSISKPNLYFKFQNATIEEADLLTTIEIDSVMKNKLKLERSLFPSDGIYQVRPWALDDREATLGIAGDHIVISVDD